MSIYYFVNNIFINKNYFFELNKINLTLYFHLINIFTKIVIVRNNNKQTIKIFKNFRLKYFFEINYFNVFIVNSKTIELTIKTFRLIYKIL